MSPRSSGSATITLGLVSIPVKLYPSVSDAAGVSFNLLHKGCGGRLKQQYVCAKDSAVVETADRTKGYEVRKDQFVIFDEEELKTLAEPPDSAIAIAEFVDAEDVPSVYVERTYYLGPELGAGRAYRLLFEAMRSTGRVALAQYAARGKLQLVAVRPHEDGLALVQLHYADEVRPFAEVPRDAGAPRPSKDELALAEDLVEQLSSEDGFVPSRYRDELKARVLAAVEAKIEGKQITFAPAAPAPETIVDLMEALRASVAAGRKRKRGPSKGSTRAKPRGRARSA